MPRQGGKWLHKVDVRWMWSGNSHTRWLCKSIWGEISENLHHLCLGHHWGNILPKVTLHPCKATLPSHMDARWLWVKMCNLSTPPCKSHLAWPFSPHMAIVTSCPHHVLSCWVVPSTTPYSHLTWPFSTSHGHTHLASTSHDHFPPCMGILTSHMWWETGHMWWMQDENANMTWEMVIRGGHEVGIATQGDFAKVYKGKFLKIFIICTSDITEVTSHPKSPHAHARQLCHLASCGNCHLTSTSHALVSSCPLHHAEVTLCDHCHLMWHLSPYIHLMCPSVDLSPPPCKSHLTWPLSPHVAIVTLDPPYVPSCQVVSSTTQKSPRMIILTWHGNSHISSTSCAPLHAKIISFTLHGKNPKKVTQQPPFHQ